MAKKILIFVVFSLGLVGATSRGGASPYYQCPFDSSSSVPYRIVPVDTPTNSPNPVTERLAPPPLFYSRDPSRENSFKISIGEKDQAVAILRVSNGDSTIRIELNFPKGGRGHDWHRLQYTLELCVFPSFIKKSTSMKNAKIKFSYSSDTDKNSVLQMETIAKFLKLEKIFGAANTYLFNEETIARLGRL